LLFPLFPGTGKNRIHQSSFVGFIYKQTAVLVDRTLPAVAPQHEGHVRMIEKECSIAIFPEGTFNETELPLTTFYDGAFKLAAAQYRSTPIIFPDMKERWHFSAWWKIWPGQNRAYILAPIAPTWKRCTIY